MLQTIREEYNLLHAKLENKTISKEERNRLFQLGFVIDFMELNERVEREVKE